MSVTQRNEYNITYTNQTQQVVVAESIAELAQQFEAPETPIDQVSIVRRGLDVVGILPLVHFQVQVTPSPAAAAGCVGTPSDYSVDPGDEVIFQAVPVSGFTFVGWYRNTVLITNSLVAKLAVAAPTIEGQTVLYEARFVAV